MYIRSILKTLTLLRFLSRLIPYVCELRSPALFGLFCISNERVESF